MLPKYRTEDYAIWNACERFDILPPNCKRSWNDCDVWCQSSLIGYNQIRCIEEAESKGTE